MEAIFFLMVAEMHYILNVLYIVKIHILASFVGMWQHVY